MNYTKEYFKLLREAADPLAEYGALREYIEMVISGKKTPEEAVDAAIEDGFLNYEDRKEAIEDFHLQATRIDADYARRHSPSNIRNMKFGHTRD